MEATATSAATSGRAPAGTALGPVFVAGRQHSGNTVMAVMLGRAKGCYSQIDENGFFEHRGLIDRLASPEARAREVFDSLKLEAMEHKEAVREHLLGAATAQPAPDALTLYRSAMDFVTRRLGKAFWAQKATSYIFYGREILAAMPDARLIYMLRSPYDIAASKKRRAKGREYIFATMYSWNKGMRIARALLREFPDRFRVVRYEDMTGSPRESAQRVFAFLGVPFDDAVLDVPHVNKSETGYSLTGDGKGLNRSRVNYYTTTLGPSEIAALDMLADMSALREWYPDLPHLGKPVSLGAKARALSRLAVSPFHFLWDYATRLPRSPAHLVARSIQRIRA
jgi:hypothetical protein